MAYPRNDDRDPDQVAADKLRGFVAEIERSDDRIKSENSHKSEVFKNAKKEGFNVKALRKVIAARRMDEVDRAKLEDDFDLYMMHVSDLAHAHVEIIEEFPPHDEDGVILEDQSTAARKDVRASGALNSTLPNLETGEARGVREAGTQAPPVDTQSTASVIVATAGVAVDTAGEASPTASSAVTNPAFHAADPGKSGGEVQASSPAPSSVVAFGEPWDGPRSSTGIKRMHGCLNVDRCASGNATRELCSTCASALVVRPGGDEIQHQGQVG